ncbi:MAG: sodium:glutamate symporter [Eubacteriales bacterium]|nr:sodium:glutamate symporter [Eubacteriales bacterium]
MVQLISWDTVLQFAFLLTLLGISLIIKSNIKFFKKHLVPTALFGGFIGLILGPEVLGWVPFDSTVLESMVYHFMAIGFIALALKKRKKRSSENITNTGFAIVNTYIFQAIIGLGITLLLAATIMPGLFPDLGLLLPLSFAQGPGNAFSTGTSFEALMPATKALADGGNIGLSLAAFGFLWAIIGGIPFMNIMRRKYKKEKTTAEEITSDTEPDVHEHTAKVPKTLYLDDLTVQAILIGVCYLLTYLLLTGLEALIGSGSLTTLFWGFQFLFGTLIAIAARKIMDLLQKKKVIRTDYADNYLLQRISSTSFDIMITAAICAISLTVLGEYIVPILILSTVGGLFTMVYSAKMAKWLYKEEKLEHAVALYGMWTGTVVTGMALLKEVDPSGKTSVPESLVLGSGFAGIIGIPLMMVISIPIAAWVNDKPWLYIVTFAVFALYSAACITGIFINKRMHAKKSASIIK